ncbi:MAG: Mrp/NBP35 family ATP-binding protein [Phycisphaeraceae bacterium]|nr:Mrp/NBP35 family ATP-binding protein [Phycisphaeraceae bacterium]
MAITREQILQNLSTVLEPELHKDIVTLGMVKSVSYCDGVALVRLEIANPTLAAKQSMSKAVEAAVRDLGAEIKQVKVEVAVDAAAAAHAAAQAKAQASQGQAGTGPEGNPLPGVRHIIAVGAGKGGVGKSTIAVNLAIGLARAGLRVGLLDGDIYGPSLPTMMGLSALRPRVTPENQIIPFEVHGVRCMTLGSLVEEDKPLIWRGPMAHSAFRQLAIQTAWGELEYLIIDLPPGTGDVPLTMSQLLPLTGAVVVCTPQKVAQDDARRAVRMFEQLNIEVLGVVENMSYFIGDDGKEYDIFGRGGAQMMAQEMGKPFLGAVPINMALRHNCDAGDPTANFTGGGALAGELELVTRNLINQVQVSAMVKRQPTLSVH